jgi:Membrane MotB of proton-channel complex MotA/MotB
MAGKPKPPEEESGEGAPLWMISFADMASLLMAFFVMLTTFSGFGPMESIKLRKVINATLAPDLYGGWFREKPLGRAGRQMISSGQSEKGSEKPTLGSPSGPGALAESKNKDFRSQKVFIIESEKTFLGSGTALSSEGREFLDPLALLLSKTSGRIAVSEVGPGGGPETGINRAITVVEYLCNNGVPKNRCSVGTRATTPETNYKTARILEITLLE